MGLSPTLQALFGLSRPIILGGILMAHVGGIAAAFASTGQFNLEAFLWSFTALFFVSISINMVNEYADHETDALTTKTRYSGGSGVLPGGRVSRPFALRAAWVNLLIGMGTAAVGAGLGAVSWNAILILALGAFGGWMYSLPPLKLAWTGYAEWANGLLGGMLLPYYGYVAQTGQLDLWAFAAFVPYGLLICTTAMATTWPDRKADAQVGKRTWATWMPKQRLRLTYAVITLSAFVALLPLLGWSLSPQVALVSLIALPAAVIAYQAYTRQENPHPTARAAMMLIFAQTTAWFWLGAQTVVA